MKFNIGRLLKAIVKNAPTIIAAAPIVIAAVKPVIQDAKKPKPR